MTKKQKAKLGLFLLPVGSILSLLTLWSVLVWPIYKTVQSQNWIQTECIVDSYETKEAGIYQSKYGNRIRYKVNIQYSYLFDGKQYTSRQESFDDGLFYGVKQPSSIPKTRKCYVNPSNPTEAVLFRRYNYYLLLLSLLPAVALGGCTYGSYRCFKALHKALQR